VEKKSTLPFVIFMTVGFVGLVVVQSLFFKPKIPEADTVQKVAGQQDPAGDELGDTPPVMDPANDPSAGESVAPRPDLPREFLTLGGFDPKGSPLVVTLDSRGATVRRVEINERKRGGALRYTDVNYRHAWIGHLELELVDGGCQVQVAAPGTPAAQAGILPGDIILTLNSEPVLSPADFDFILAGLDSDSNIEIGVRRGEELLTLTAASSMMPMQIIRPTDPQLLSQRELKRRGFQFTLKRQAQGDWPDLDPGMRSRNWQGQIREVDGREVAEFTYDLPADAEGRQLQVLKRYSLSDDPERRFHVDL
jgi:membrane-associated protease RseP (regulator of RpoE activity)